MDRKSQLKELLITSPGDSFLLFAMAKEFETEKDWESAIDYYHQILENEPTYIGAYYHLAQALIEMNEKASALIVYDKGIEIAKTINDHHALAELQNAKMNLSILE